MPAPPPLRVIVADDERPARRYLMGVLHECADVDVCGDAASGEEAIELIGRVRPDLALLDLQMPEVGGLEVVRRLSPGCLPLVAFVTAFDDFAVAAFDVNAIDYVVKPAEPVRLQATLDRARRHLRGSEPPPSRVVPSANAVGSEPATRRPYLERVPVRRRDDVVLLSVRQIAYVESEGELLHLVTVSHERYTLTHRLHTFEARLDPRRFVRLSRGTLANVELITKVSPMPGGTCIAVLANGQQLQVSRIQSRILRDTLLRL